MSNSNAGGTIAANLALVKERIRKAAESVGRDPASVELVAVSKTFGADAILEAIAAGQRAFGENRVQETEDKWPAIRERFPDVRVHLIGPLQRNKTKRAVTLFDAVETVDRARIARALADEMQAAERRIECFVEVNTGEEEQKSGVLPLDADAFIKECREVCGLSVAGLMCIPPQGEEPALHFALLREIAKRNGIEGLSMGMTADFETAIQFGATHVRVGTAIFGARTKAVESE